MKLHLCSEGEPVHSTFSGDFKYAGELMASSIVQGGPAPNFFARWLYLYITGELDNVESCVNDIKDKNLKDIVRHCLRRYNGELYVTCYSIVQCICP